MDLWPFLRYHRVLFYDYISPLLRFLLLCLVAFVFTVLNFVRSIRSPYFLTAFSILLSGSPVQSIAWT